MKTSQTTVAPTQWREPTMVGILATGAVALGVILATAVVYIGNADVLALALVGLMAAATIYGVLELVRCVRAVQHLDAGLAALPANATSADLDAGDRRLRAMLRSRIEGNARPLRGAEFTPYLVGLLVMLGLLGTFLGLFDAMRGARMVVAGSRDANGLQEALSAPLGGLTLSFGTSAAGLAASAMLGLGSVLLRRRERTLEFRLADVATGSLASLSPARRQEQLLEQAAAQSAAMPEAAAALRTAVEQLSGLGDLWANQQRDAAERSADAFAVAATKVTDAFELGMQRSGESLACALADVKGSLESSVQRATATVGSTMGPLVERAVDGTVAAAADHLAKAHALIETDASQRNERDAERWQRFDARIDTLVARLEAGDIARREADELAAEARLEADQGAAERTRTHFEALFGQLEATEQARREADANAVQTRREADAAAAARLAEQLDALVQRFDAAESARRDADASAAAQFATQFESLFDRIDAGVGAQRTTVTELGATYEQQVQSLATSHREQVAALAARLDADLDTRRAFEEKHWQTLGERMAEVAEQSREYAATDREERLATAEAVRDLFADTAERDRDRGAQVSSLAERVQAELSATVQAARESLATTADAVREQLASVSESVSKQLTDTSELAAVQLSTVADADAARHEHAGKTMAALSEASAALVEQIDTAIGKQREQWQAFEGQLLAMHKAAFDAAGNRLKLHVDQVGEQISHVTGSARTATDKLAAGSGELTAVAQMLAASVDRHRDAANLWLDSLGAVDAAVQDAGESAAAEALAKQLVSTSELFAQQLEFHREMFEQLKGLRAVDVAAHAADANAGKNGGTDHVRA